MRYNEKERLSFKRFMPQFVLSACASRCSNTVGIRPVEAVPRDARRVRPIDVDTSRAEPLPTYIVTVQPSGTAALAVAEAPAKKKSVVLPGSERSGLVAIRQLELVLRNTRSPQLAQVRR